MVSSFCHLLAFLPSVSLFLMCPCLPVSLVPVHGSLYYLLHHSTILYIIHSILALPSHSCYKQRPEVYPPSSSQLLIPSPQSPPVSSVSFSGTQPSSLLCLYSLPASLLPPSPPNTCLSLAVPAHWCMIPPPHSAMPPCCLFTPHLLPFPLHTMCLLAFPSWPLLFSFLIHLLPSHCHLPCGLFMSAIARAWTHVILHLPWPPVLHIPCMASWVAFSQLLPTLCPAFFSPVYCHHLQVLP